MKATCTDKLLRMFWTSCSELSEGLYGIQITKTNTNNCNCCTPCQQWECTATLVLIPSTPAPVLPNAPTWWAVTDSNGWAYDCWDPILTWIASATSGVTYTIREWASVIASLISGTSYILTWVSDWLHTYTIEAVNANGSSSTISVSFTKTTCATAPATVPVMWTGTTSVANITATWADLTGTYTSDGWAAITWTWFVLYPAGNPSTVIWGASVTQFPDWTLPSPINATATWLSNATNYCFKPYAINSVGTSYGDEICFTTLAAWPTVITVAPWAWLIANAWIYAPSWWGKSQCWWTWTINISYAWSRSYWLLPFNPNPRDLTYSTWLFWAIVNKKLWFNIRWWSLWWWAFPNTYISPSWQMLNLSWYDMQRDVFMVIDWGTPILLWQTNIAADWTHVSFEWWVSWANVTTNVRIYFTNSAWYPSAYCLWMSSYNQSHSLSMFN